MRDIKKIIIHCSDSSFGDEVTIDKWHKARGWDGTGYHWVITNGVRKAMTPYVSKDDGVIERGRPEAVVGAHCKGYNTESIGVCLIGKRGFTYKQLFVSLPKLLKKLKRRYPDATIHGHYEFNDEKTCPNMPVKEYLEIMEGQKREETDGIFRWLQKLPWWGDNRHSINR